MELSEREYMTSAVRDRDAPDLPLLTEVMNRTSSAQDVASEIASRLFTLKDRLFGPDGPSNTAAGSKGVEKPPQCFAGAYADRAITLHQTLCHIDALTTEIANRL